MVVSWVAELEWLKAVPMVELLARTSVDWSGQWKASMKARRTAERRVDRSAEWRVDCSALKRIEWMVGAKVESLAYSKVVCLDMM
jgi:hypothetical protein